MNEVPAVSMHSGKVQNDGGDHSAPGQVHPPPGAWPGAVTEPLADWSAGDDLDDIVTGPLPALQHLAAGYATTLTATERLAFLRATASRGGAVDGDNLDWLLGYAEGRANRDQVVLAGLEMFYLHMKAAVVGNGKEKEEVKP